MEKRATYTVEIERKKREDWTEPKYYVKVEVELDGRYTYDLNYSKFTYRLKTAKKCAIKHILSTQKELEAGVTFGIVYTTSGTAAEVVDKLKES